MKNLKKRGFTLIEMLIVVVIIGILAAALIPRLGSAKGKANDSQRNTAMSQIGTAFGTYVLDYGLPTTGNAPGGTTADELSGVLSKGGLVTIPKDPKATESRDAFGDGLITGTYKIYQVKKGSATGIVIIANVESPTSANWVDGGGSTKVRSGGTDMGTFKWCNTVSEASGTPVATSNGECTAPAGKWRKIVVY